MKATHVPVRTPAPCFLCRVFYGYQWDGCIEPALCNRCGEEAENGWCPHGHTAQTKEFEP